ncbi:hypothetical protein A3H04_01420 [Candidatus Giovannonibacteria bacterium RIFCSPLOWO2_12_FULL_43_11c]|nr:MAG: hypothetical protein A3B97_01255 [Candidatus Giovannonibacteria bacterium RIFCSPHIGHO2_02_FULL_43_32]OGF92373.1 MAG: hypothetical protein A3H04_01420 [Candidatus Giovannonibacteria bacterium RIFCSPLOWO2_12_FULL_43_11c]
MSNEMPTNDEEFLRQEQTAESQEWRERQDSYADLGSYIKMHKTEELSQEDPEMDKKLKEQIKELKLNGIYWTGWSITKTGEFEANPAVQFGYDKHAHFQYFDRSGNITSCDIDAERILVYKRKDVGALGYLITQELQKLGFRKPPGNPNSPEAKSLGEVIQEVSSAISRKERRLEQEAKEKKTKEFDF